ncbi:MAG: hypothetical protein IT181_05580, partial [Acidobacteria bacterium]|nr:hypothetical protein [Acidobacteriota bacterium]
AIQRIRASDEWRGQAGWLADSPQAALAHYNALVFSKMAWLADAARSNPFGASHLFWIDAGLLNTVPAPFLKAPALAQRLVTAADAFLWVEYPYPDGREIHGFPRAELTALAGVTDVDRVARGGFFGGPVDQVGAVAQRYADLQRSTLAHGLMGTEESLFTILAYREPERYAHYLIERNGLLAPFFEAVVAGAGHARRSAPAVRPVALVPPAPQPAGPDDIEVPADVERGLTSFFGMPLMQNRRAILALDRVLHHLDASGQRVARIIELGTGTGGLSVLFRIFTLTTGAAFTTYDRWDCTSPAGRLFERLGVDARRDDTGADFTAAAIARDIQRPGVTLLVCDGADKVADVTRFVPFLKTGDVVMAHDYAASTAEFGERLRGRAWNWCEITDGDLTAVTAAHALEPVCPELLGPAAWMCRVKRGPHVVPAPRVQAESGRLAVYLLTYNAPAQLALWFETAARVEPQLVAGGAPRILLDNSTDDGAARQNAALAQRFGFTYTRAGNLGIVGGRVWCARHFAEHDEADVMIFFEDDMLLHESAGLCRNGLPTSVPGLLTAAVAILQNEVSLDYLKLSYTEFYGDHRKNWAYYNVAPAERAAMFPDGPDTRIAAIKSHRGVSYALGEVHYSNWPLLITRRGNERLFLQTSEAAQFEQTLMVRALELARAGELEGAVLLASPINHDRQVHYEGGRKES